MTHKQIIELPFVKMHGIGNDYVYLDTFDDKYSDYLIGGKLSKLSRKISDRHFGVGSDGMILILPSDIADFRMRIFNSDGSEAQMCGNGIRCVAKYVFEKNMTQKTSIDIETRAGIKHVDLFIKERHVESIRVDMGKPILEPSLIPVVGEKRGDFFSGELEIQGKIFNITAIGMGNPHCVVFSDELSDSLIDTYGPLLESHEIFPEKTNVEFIRIIDRNHIEMRVWERGSKETLACGTGACAAAVASWLNGLTEREVEVNLLGGKLRIEIDKESGHVYMTGGAEFIAKGVYFYEVDI